VSTPKRKWQTKGEKKNEILVKKVYWTKYTKQKASERTSEEICNNENVEMLQEHSDVYQEKDDEHI